MTTYLRHTAKDLDVGGFVSIDKLTTMFATTKQEIIAITKADDKNRFEVQNDMIRCRQGHSISMVEDEKLLTEITDVSKAATFNRTIGRWEVVHGTSLERLGGSIAILQWKYGSGGDPEQTGLKKMSRNHIHMVKHTGVPRFHKWYSVYVFVDIEAAMRAGIKFYLSGNGVILSPGNAHGVIPSRFLTIHQR